MAGVDLLGIRETEKRLEQAEENYRRAAARATSISVSMDGMPHGRSTESSTERGAIECLLAGQVRDDLRRELREKRRRLEPAISTLEDQTVQRVVRMRYVCGYSLTRIAIETAYSRTSVYNKLVEGEERLNSLNGQA